MAKQRARELMTPDSSDLGDETSANPLIPSETEGAAGTGISTLENAPTTLETAPPASSESPPVAAVEVDPAANVLRITLEIPLANPMTRPGGHTGYVPCKADLRLNARQRDTLNRLFFALHSGGVKRASGFHVDRRPHALLWLLDQIAVKEAEARSEKQG